MWTAFFFDNAHFAANFFAALVFFAMFWLYFDAWLERKAWDEVPKLLGILLLSVSFVIHATQLGSGSDSIYFLVTRIVGYLFLIVGVVLDPLQPAPKTRGLSVSSFVLGIKYYVLSITAFPILSAIVTWLYLRRATVGLERHLKTVTIAFFVLTVSEALGLGGLFIKSPNVWVYKLVAPFGVIWIAQHIMMFMGVGILGGWVWQYLTKRLGPQLFMIFTATILGIFLITTTVFTALLLKNMQDETLARLETDVKVLGYGIESRKQQVLSDASSLAQREDFSVMVSESNRVGISPLVGKYLLNKALSSLIVVDNDGRVLARGEDRERVGDSLSSDGMVERGLLGKEVASVVVKDGVLSPEVLVKAVSPVVVDGKTVGAVVAGIKIDNAFVDGIKLATGLEAAVYGQDVLAATTQVSTDGKSRWVGTRNQGLGIRDQVLGKGKSYSGSQNVLNTPYFVSYMPLKDVDDVAVGMLFVGRPQVSVLAAASKSIEATFLATAVLVVIAVGPAFVISKFIADQLS